LNEHRVGKDADRIAEEVIQQLTDAIGAEVEITIQIQAHFPNAASEQVIRTVTERTVKPSNPNLLGLILNNGDAA
jgi:hypothetical protein